MVLSTCPQQCVPLFHISSTTEICDTIFFPNLVVKLILWAPVMNCIWFPQKYARLFSPYQTFIHSSLFEHFIFYFLGIFVHQWAHHLDYPWLNNVLLPHIAKFPTCSSSEISFKILFLCFIFWVINPNIVVNQYLAKSMETWNLSY